MAQGNPAGWEELKQSDVGQDDPWIGRYRATFVGYNRTQGSGQIKQNIKVITNRFNGNYDVYTTAFGVGDKQIYSYNASNDETIIQNQGIYEQVFTGQNAQQRTNLDNGVRKATLALAKNNVGGTGSTSAQQLQTLQNSPGYKSVGNAAPPGGGAQPPGGGAQPPEPTQNPIDPNDISVPDAPDVRKDYNNKNGEKGIWAYPKDIGRNGQDYIKFQIIQYEPRKISPNSQTGALLADRPSTGTPLGTIILPIQPSITDMNTVDWNDIGANPLDMSLANLSLSIFTGQGTQGMENYFDYLSSQLKDSGVQNAAKLAIAQKAASTQGLLSRVTGAVVNNNLELLFNGPQLRPFDFTFSLSPRGEEEARTVKGIIRAFKEAMAVKVASSQLFLKAPNVFKISYVVKGGGEHSSLNKIKMCALQSCSVDYTPNGSYATFADNDATMVSYNLALKFQELEPVTSKDYDKDYTSIGY